MRTALLTTSIIALALPWIAACMTMEPLQALGSTIPLDLTNKKLAYIGDIEGRACKSSILFLFPLEADASIFSAKTRALQSAAHSTTMPVVGIVDVTM